MSLLFLSTDDFALERNDKGDVLYHEIRGFSLILYYSTQCGYCQKIMPVFKRLAELINGCQFGMVNVSMNKTLIQMSAHSSSPIRYVPLLILYINGRPYMRYEGPHEENDIRRFILEVTNSVQSSGFAEVAKEKNIPAYTIGQPLCGEDGVCYLEFDSEVGYKRPIEK